MKAQLRSTKYVVRSPNHSEGWGHPRREERGRDEALPLSFQEEPTLSMP